MTSSQLTEKKSNNQPLNSIKAPKQAQFRIVQRARRSLKILAFVFYWGFLSYVLDMLHIVTHSLRVAFSSLTAVVAFLIKPLKPILKYLLTKFLLRFLVFLTVLYLIASINWI